MIFFILGSSSVGKSRLIQWLLQNIPSSTAVVGDKIFPQVRTRLVNEANKQLKAGSPWPYKDPGQFHQVVQDETKKEIVKQLNTVPNTRTVFVDDIISNVQRYIKNLKKPFKVILIGTTLKQLNANILARAHDDTRSAASVLTEVIDYYDPVNKGNTCKGLVFKKSELDEFQRLKQMKLHGIVAKDLNKAIKAFSNKFFKHSDECFVCASKRIMHVDYMVLHDDTARAGNAIKKIVSQH
jgi:hypothetical protein